MTTSPPHEIEFTELEVGRVYLVKEGQFLPASLEKNGKVDCLVAPGKMLLCLEIDPWFTQAKFLQVSDTKKMWVLFIHEDWLKPL
jgi:hypothetical protein